MVWPPQDTGIFEFKMPCCSCAIGCPLSLLIPAWYNIFDAYADEATAQAVLDDPLRVANCLMTSFIDDPQTGTIPSSFSASFSGDTLSFDIAYNYIAGPGLNGITYAAVKLAEGDVVTINYSGTSNPYPKRVTFWAFSCTGEAQYAFVTGSERRADTEFIATIAGSFSWTAPAAGEYILQLTWDQPPGYNFTQVLTTINSYVVAGGFTVHPVLAQYFDGTDIIKLDCTP